MSAVMEAREPSVKYLSTLQPPLVQQFELMATAPGGVARLRELILTLAVQGKLVPQDPSDEPASELLKKIRAEKDRLIAEGRIKRDKTPTDIADEAMPYGLPLGWEWSNLSTIGIINPRNVASDETVASFVQMSSIPVAFAEPHIAEPRPWRDIKSGFTQFAEGDVGVAKITPCFENGKSTVFKNLSNGIGAGTTELHIVRPLCGVKPQYVLMFLKTPAFLKRGEAVMTGSAGQKRMPRAYFESTPFPLPPLAEQASIVTRVEELLRLCDALEAKSQLEAEQHAQLVQTLLGALTASTSPKELTDNWQRVATHFDLLLDRPEAIDALEQTILQLAVRGLLVPQNPEDEPASELLKKIRAEKDRLISEGKLKRDKLPTNFVEEVPFDAPRGWTWTTLSEICALITDGTHQTPKYTETGRPFLSAKNVKPFRFMPELHRFVSDADFHALRKGRIPNKGDILMTRVGAMIGEAAVIDQEIEFAFYVSLALLGMPGSLVSSDFLAAWLNSPYGTANSVEKTLGRGVSAGNLNLTFIRSFAVPLPPAAEQDRIIERIGSLRRLCSNLRQRLAACQTTQAHLAEALIDEVA